MTYPEIIEKIKAGEKFDFSRWGDGEWSCLLQARPGKANCDHHQYFPSMGSALRAVLEQSPTYHLGLQSLAKRLFPDQIQEYTSKYNLTWCNSNVLHRQNIKHGLNGMSVLFDALKDRDVLLVGPNHLSPLAAKYGWYQLKIPPRNCWLEFEEIQLELNTLIALKDWVVMYCASMMANVLIHGFHGQVTQLDVGSAFDPYVGVKSRGYHKQMI